MNRRRPMLAYVLMIDKVGWRSLARPLASSDSDYLRVERDLPEVNVPKGTLVEVDPEFVTPGSSSVVVISLDRQGAFCQGSEAAEVIKLSVMFKELSPIEHEVSLLLLPLKPSARYRILTRPQLAPILYCEVGHTVIYSPEPFGWSESSVTGLVEYVGPIPTSSNEMSPGPVGTWVGVELFDEGAALGNGGNGDGRINGTRYFSAAPNSAVFATVDKLMPFEPDTEETSSTAPSRVDRRQVSPSKGTSKKRNGCRTAVGLGSRIVWLTDYGPQFGVVRWIGKPQQGQDFLAGVDFDNPIGEGDGRLDGKQVFTPTQGHGQFVPLDCLLRAEDFNDNNRGGERRPPGDSPLGSVENEVSWSNQAGCDPHRRGRSRLSSTLGEQADRDATSPLGGPSTFEDIQSVAIPSSLEEDPPKGTLSKSEQSSCRGARTAPSSCSKQSQLSESLSLDAEARISAVKDKEEEEAKPEEELERLFDVLREGQGQGEEPIEVGSLVELRIQNVPVYGVVCWLGRPSSKGNDAPPMAGIELEEALPGVGTSGWFHGERLFQCASGKGVFVPFTHFRQDSRFGCGETSRRQPEFGGIECPAVEGFHPPLAGGREAARRLFGRNRGIQGHQNSCYLDATLFAMFSFTSIFDFLLYRPANRKDIPQYELVQKVLREDIVNPLRKNMFVRADKVMKLRQLLDSLTSVKGLMSEEKDPEELLNSLLSQTLKASPFLELAPSNQSAHLYQLFVERDPSRKAPPTVQELFEQSFLTSQIKLKSVPSVLILQMPRFGKQFKAYDRIMPSQLLDVTDVIENSPRQCVICGKLAVHECMSCFGDHGTGLDSTAFCDDCHCRVHCHAKRRDHSTVPLQVPEEFRQHQLLTSSLASTPRLFMELFAVVCIETSHYVSFVKCGSGPDAPWCFFDSMADRKGEADGYNIPEVSDAPDISTWFRDNDSFCCGGGGGANGFSNIPLGDQTKRLVCDAYMCFYQSSDVMMYQ